MLGAPAGTAGEISREGHVGGAKKVSLFSSALHNQSFDIFSLTIGNNPKRNCSIEEILWKNLNLKSALRKVSFV